VDDEYGYGRVVEDEVRNGAQESRPDRTTPAGTHHDQIVVCGCRTLHELEAGVSDDRTSRYGDALWNERLSLGEYLLRRADQVGFRDRRDVARPDEEWRSDPSLSLDCSTRESLQDSRILNAGWSWGSGSSRRIYRFAGSERA